MNNFLSKAIQVQSLNSIEAQLDSNVVTPFKNDGEHHYSIKEVKPESQMPVLFDKEITITNLLFDNKFEGLEDAYKDGVLLFVGLKSGSNIIREYTIHHRGRTIDGSLQNDATIESFINNTIKQKSEKNNRKQIQSLYENIHEFDTSACGTYITMRVIDEAVGQQTNFLYLTPVRFRISVHLDNLLIFQAFTDNSKGMFGDLEMKFKINPKAFVFLQVNSTESLAKYYTMKMDDIIADLIIGIRTEQLPPSGLKNLVCDIAPVTVSIKNYVVTEVTANMAGYKATDACLATVRDFFSTRAFVVPAQRVEIWPFPTSATLTGIRTSQNIPISHVTDFVLLFTKDARCTTCFENPCYQNMQLTICGRNFPDMPMNTTDQQFFKLQLNASNLDLLFEATDEFEDALTTSKNTATRRLNPNTDLTFFMITLQYERNNNDALTFDRLDTMNQIISVELNRAPIYQGVTDCYYNVDTAGKRPPPPILCTVHDTFWLFSRNQGGSCNYDTTHSFDEVVNEIGD
ncbi:MAG: hypothetical protein EZS28_010179 [Streblomastix strix]|uniref:Uncharacterized protein n=1 Tax=Streblomastix strix TaxID=222440 RepID=A0A5J4WI01_9EUKA|nr:MAG: hypothetical protein EZS28_010179 [Streblomastix strix]